MIDINSIEIFKDSICAISETSIDNHDGNVNYMTDSSLNVVNFDRAKEIYIESLRLPEPPKSSDALFVNKDMMYLIEFKNGRMDSKKSFDVRRKMFDSLLILTDILQIGVSCTRQNLNYILVYNETMNPVRKEEEEKEMQLSPSRTDIASRLLNLGLEKLIRFNLKSFERIYFKDVFTVTINEFNKHFLTIWVEN